MKTRLRSPSTLRPEGRSEQQALITPRVVKTVIAFLTISGKIKDSGISNVAKGAVDERQRVAQHMHFRHHLSECDKAVVVALWVELVDAV